MTREVQKSARTLDTRRGYSERVNPSVVPELIVSDIATTLGFYRDVLGFSVLYERPEERFAYLARGTAHIMVEQPTGRAFLAADLVRPFGRGMNLQIEVADVDAVYASAVKSGATLELAIEEKWYRRDEVFSGSRQFVVQDPDGYLLRFFTELGERPNRD